MPRRRTVKSAAAAPRGPLVAGGSQLETVRIHRSRPRWRSAVLTGLAAFALGATGLTIAEAVIERSFADGRQSSTLFGAREDPPAAAPPPALSDPLQSATPTPTRSPARRRP